MKHLDVLLWGITPHPVCCASCPEQVGPPWDHGVCTALPAAVLSCPFGRNLCKCVLLFPLPKLFQSSLLFFFIPHCRSLLLSACSLVVAPAPLGCSLSAPVTPLCTLDLLFTRARMRLFNRAFIPILSRIHSPLAAFASKMPAH